MPEPAFYLEGPHVWWVHDCHVHLGEGPALVPVRTWARLPTGEQGWTVVQAEPLTVTPSIACQGCGTHGFITNGRWVDV